MKKKKIFLLLVMAVVLLPLWMWLSWMLTSKRKLVVAIIDKTVVSTREEHHISLDWVLNQGKFTKTKSSLYNPSHDYYGFYPDTNGHFQIKGLERFSTAQLKELSTDADMVYFTDTYGIYKNKSSALIYGGMSNQDIVLLKEMKSRHKLMIAEFNTIGSPTPALIRNQFEALFGLRWTGWTARYFSSLDSSANDELPVWLVNNYKLQHKGQWPFRQSGIAFINNNGQVVILEASTHLTDPVPSIESNSTGRRELDLPEKVKYPFWFDIIDQAGNENEIAADFVIHANKPGKAVLNSYKIPGRFPAVIRHISGDYQFYYFSGDFCNNQISLFSSFFKGISWFRWLFYNTSEPNERKSFFWNFYRPMMSRILEDYYQQVQQHNKTSEVHTSDTVNQE